MSRQKKTRMPRTEEFYKNRRRTKRIRDLKKKKHKGTKHEESYR